MGGKQKENEAYGKAGATGLGLWREVAEVGSKQKNYLGLFPERALPGRMVSAWATAKVLRTEVMSVCADLGPGSGGRGGVVQGPRG